MQSSGLDSDSEDDGQTRGREMWHSFAQQQHPAPAARMVPGASHTPLELYNTRTVMTEQRRTAVLMVDSLDRDQLAYPLPTTMRLQLPRVYHNVERIDIVQIKMLNGIYAFSADRENTTLPVRDASGDFKVTIPDGSYSMQQLVNAVSAELNGAGRPVSYNIAYDCTTGRILLDASGAAFSLPFNSSLPLSKRELYSGWGLGWNLGFGGQPVDLSGATTYMASYMPRLFDDYIFLRLNPSETMNTVDHTSLENLAVTQKARGRVDYYFGKLLLNNFGCYSQTFVESPKEFRPVLGRLDRMQFEWVDRFGNVLTGPDAASCDWHMVLRITEIKEGPNATSSLTMSTRK